MIVDCGRYEVKRGNSCYCRSGYKRTATSDGACTRIVVLPPPIIKAPPPIITVACKGKPGAGPKVEVAGTGENTIALARGSFPVEYGGRERKLFNIKSLPPSLARQTSTSDGRTPLYADAYVDVPADPEYCKGSSTSGGELRIVDVPMERGGLAPACVQFCPGQPTLVSTTPPPIKPRPKPKGTPPKTTVIATPYTEPRKRAVPTTIATPYTEPQKRAVPTVIATPFTEPQKRAVPTVVAAPFTEPQKRAVPTVVAASYVEQGGKKPPTKKKAVPTVMATSYIEKTAE